jgi:GNAT superfamily N-acetyltransferase
MAQIVRFAERPDSKRARAQINAIFFANAATADFADDTERRAYHELWLGRYLRHFPDMAFVALNEAGQITGYLAGSPISDHPPLPGPDYYEHFPDLLAKTYPAHLHVNVHTDFRGRKIGAALIDAFRKECNRRALTGFHAITLASSGAAHFFAGCGMKEVGSTISKEKKLVFLAEAGERQPPPSHGFV